MGLISRSKAIRPSLLAVRVLAAQGVFMLAVFLFGVLPVQGQEDSADETTGKLVVVPSVLTVGDTTEAVAFHVEPADLEVTIEYSEHFVPEGDACGSGQVGTTTSAKAPTWINLTACTAGKGLVRLLGAGTDTVIEEMSVTITGAVARGTGQRQAQTSPSIDLSSVQRSMEPGESDSFTVEVDDLDSGESYVVHTVALNPVSLGFDSNCDDSEATRNISGTTSRTFSDRVYACEPAGSGLWAYLKHGEDFVANTGAGNNFIKVPHVLSISVDDADVREGTSIEFTVESEFDAVSSIGVRISVTENGDFIDGTPPSRVTIRGGRDSVSFTVRTDNDEDCETNGSITATIKSDTTREPLNNRHQVGGRWIAWILGGVQP